MDKLNSVETPGVNAPGKKPKEKKPLKERIRKSAFLKALVLWAVSIVILAFLIDKLLMPTFAGAFAKTGTIPDLVRMTPVAAEAALTEAGFKYEWLEEGRYSADVDSGKVLVQMPVAGRTAKLGRTVRLTKSLGLRVVEIPDLRGKSQKQAAISLSRAGLVQGATVKGAHASIPRNVVIRTIPDAGEKVRVGDTVKVVINAGDSKGKVLLPDFSGQQLDDVYSQLDKLGFKLGKITRQKDSEGRRPGTVLETNPKSGDYLTPGFKINFVVVD